ncbi:hypothetical protein ACQPXH_17105 [Nocardia sp. CA-135953]|uniref:hypothetical protein n=1 Tax=Nocardia sp. CA-135953 TaxID=3239978 RepID=UPI003D9571FD
MSDRKVVLFKRWPMASAFAVLLIAASAVLGPHAAAQSCAAVDLVMARGTQEPGYLGTYVGDPLYDAMRRALPMSACVFGELPREFDGCERG